MTEFTLYGKTPLGFVPIRKVTSTGCCLGAVPQMIRVPDDTTLYSLPISGDSPGVSSACNRCTHQLACLAGRIEHRERKFQLS